MKELEYLEGQKAIENFEEGMKALQSFQRCSCEGREDEGFSRFAPIRKPKLSDTD